MFRLERIERDATRGFLSHQGQDVEESSPGVLIPGKIRQGEIELRRGFHGRFYQRHGDQAGRSEVLFGLQVDTIGWDFAGGSGRERWLHPPCALHASCS
jgi:hypothetical protein